MNKYFYAYEKLTSAIHSLTIGPGDIRSRLQSSFLGLAVLNEDDFPTELQGKWSKLRHALTKAGPIMSTEGKVIISSTENTMQRIKNRTGVKLAHDLIELHERITKYLDP